MIEPPIDERYELAAVKDSLTPDERKAAEHAYTVSAFDYEKAPVGSRDWTLFWSGWQKCAAQKAQPPCGADGAVPDELAADVAALGVSLDVGGYRNDAELLYKAAEKLRLLSAQPAAPVAPAIVAVPDCEWCQDDDVHLPGTWDGACGAKWTFTDGGPKENDVRFCMKCGGHVLLAASQREGGGT